MQRRKTVYQAREATVAKISWKDTSVLVVMLKISLKHFLIHIFTFFLGGAPYSIHDLSSLTSD